MEREILFVSRWGRRKSPREPRFQGVFWALPRLGGGEDRVKRRGSSQVEVSGQLKATYFIFCLEPKQGLKSDSLAQVQTFKEVEIHHQIVVFWCWTEIFYTYNVWVLCNDQVMTRKFIKNYEFNFHFWVSKGAQQSSPSSAFLLQKFPDSRHSPGQVSWRLQWKTIPFLPAPPPGSSQMYFSCVSAAAETQGSPATICPDCRPIWVSEEAWACSFLSYHQMQYPVNLAHVRKLGPRAHLILPWREELNTSGLRFIHLEN